MKSIFNRFLSVLCLLFVGIASTFAERISLNDAALVANNFMNTAPSSSLKKGVAPKRMVLKKSASTEQPQFYIYENADGEGWVMVAANDIAHPILAYSETGKFRTDNQPTNLKSWLGHYEKEIQLAEQKGVQATNEIVQEWRTLRNGGAIRKATPVVSPLIQTGWDQTAPFWNDCPKKGGNYAYTGCVATAMAQVLNYWQWPNTGVGSNSVMFNSTTYTVDFTSGNYDWANMLNIYTSSANASQKAAVAKLMYHCGVAAGMEYGTDGSGAYTINWNDESEACAQNALWKYLKYKKSSIKGYYRNGSSGYYTSWTKTNWINMLKAELDAGRPILYAGDDNGSPTPAGHSFVCDGYDSSDKMHFNWGWENWCDGYYDVDALETTDPGSGGGNGNYSYHQDVIVGIIPDKPNITITWSVQGVTSTTTQTSGTLVLPATTPSDCTSGKKFVGWTEQSSVTGTKPSDLFTSGSGKTVTENKTFYAVYATAGSGSGSGTPVNLIEYDGADGRSSLEDIDGVTVIGVADYAAANSPYLLKFDGNGDYIQFDLSVVPTSLSFDYKMIGGGNTSTMTIKECATSNGDYTNVEALSISGSQNSTGTLTTSNSFSQKFIRMVFTKGSNVGVGSITIVGSGGGTTYSDYSLTCTTCTLSDIALNTSGATTTFTVGDAFTYEGLVVTASYDDCSDRTVSPTSVSTPDMSSVGDKTVTVTYTESGVTKTKTYTITVNPLPTYTIRFFDGTTQICANQEVTSGQSAIKPSDPVDCTDNGYTFVGWYTSKLADDNTTVTSGWITDFTATQNQDYFAVYNHTVTTGSGGTSTVNDELTRATTTVTGTSYSDWSGKTATSDAVYAGNSAGGNSSIQLRSSSNSGIITTASGGKAKKITVSWNSNTAADRTLNVYGKNAAYSSTSDLYSGTAATQGALLGTIVYGTSTELSITGDYTFIGLRSNSGAMYLSSVTIQWEEAGGGSSTTYYTGTKDCTLPTEVTITFHKNDGTDETTSQTINYNTATALTANTFSRTGYTFQGWATSTSGAKTYDDEQNVTLTSNIDLYAVWQINSHNVTFSTPTGATSVTVNSQSTSPQTADYGSTVTIAVTPATTHVVNSVTVTGDITVTDNGDNTYSFTMPDNDVTVTVTMSIIPTYTVTWSANGTTTTEQYAEGAAITFPATATGCDGKVFMGWVSTAIPTPQDNEPTYVTSATMGTSDLTYYAVFADEDDSGSGTGSKTFIFESIASANGWTNGTAYTTVPNSPVTLSAAGGGNNGKYYTSDHSWRMYSGGTVNISVEGGSVTSVSSTPSRTFTISGGTASLACTATTQFTVITVGYTVGGTSYSGYSTSCVIPTEVTVTFDANGGEGTMADQTIPYNTATALTANSFSRTGYTFLGWATSATGDKVHNDQAPVTLVKNTTLYAVWQKNSYTITLDVPANATIETSPASTAEYEATVTVTVTPATGYTFGSITVTNNTTGTTITTSGTGNEQTFTMPASNVTVTATVNEIPKYTVTWSMDGDISNTAEYAEGEEIVFPTTATGCDGMTFRGWSASTVAETDVEPTYVTSATMGTSDLTYYAVFANASGSSSGSGPDPGTTLWAETFSSYDANDVPSGAVDNSNTGTTVYGTGSVTYACADGTTSTKIYTSGGPSSGNNLLISKGNGTFTVTGIPTGGATELTVTYEKSGSGSIKLTVSDNASKSGNASGSTITVNSGSTIDITFENTNGSNNLRFDNVAVKVAGEEITYSGYTTTCGASISAKNIGWITATKGQKVKRDITVSAKGFDEETTLSVACNNTNFHVSLAETIVSPGAAGLTTTLTVEYNPADFGIKDENVDITLTAGDKSKTITVSGRSVPDEFLLITQKSSKWYALPANMTSGLKEYDGVEVNPNDATTPTAVAVSPSTIIYTLTSVVDARYAESGNCVRLVGNDNLCLWSNLASSTGKTNIQNKTGASGDALKSNEWLLTTSDGVHYTIANPNHPQYPSRRLAYGAKFGMYEEETVFYIVSAGCSSQPDDVRVSPRRTDATFSWVSNASSLTIDVYTNEEMTEGHLQSTAKSSPYMMMGLTEDTKYWFKLTPEGSAACSVTGNFKTTGPVIDVVEWEENAAIIFVDKDEELKPRIVIDGEVEHGAGSGATATDLFFSKYFEGAGDMKLVAIFNGTTSDISLAEYSLYTKNCGAPKKEADIATSTFGSTTTYPISALGTIKANQEIIFFTRPSDGDTPASCSGAFLNEKATHSGEDENPRWIECNNSTYYGGSKFPLMTFNGNDAICLEKNSSLIDVIGSASDPGKVKNCANRLNDLGWAINVKNIDYGKTVNDASFADLYDASSLTPTTDVEKKAILNGFGVDLDNEYINLTSARCILFRDKRVTSGDSAVLMNTGADFVTCTEHIEAGVTYLSEWNGRAVCMDAAMQTAAGVSDDGQATCNSYQDLGIFNYSEYYKEWNTILPGVILDENVRDPEAKTYEIEIPELAKYSCLNLKFQLTDKDDVSHVYTEQEVQVPILVKDEHTTVDQIFNSIVKTDGGDPLYDESIQRCQTCDVVVLGGGLLTKATDGTTHDAPEIGNLKVYPGGKVVVPEGTTYTVNSLALRRQEDALSLAQVEGTLSIKQPNSTFLDIRIDPSNWHYFTLPYDVNVSDIKFVDGTPAAIGTDFRIGTYDGEHRAATQSASWVYLNSEDVLKAGLGYIIGLPGSGKVQRELRFPMANEVITAEKEDKDIAGFHAWGGDKSDEELRPNHKGWNLLGAPYLTYYQTSLQDPLPMGELIHDPDEDPWQGHWVRNTGSLRYIVVPVDNGRSEYEQVNIANYHMAPFTSYFVQIGGSDPAADQTISYTASQAGKLSIVRRAVQEEVEDNHEVWFGVELVNADGLKDETALLISDKFTDDYDIMDDLVKMRGQYYQYAQITTKPVLASRNLKGEMAFNALPDSTAAAGVPLNFFAAKDGDYRFTISGNYPLDEVKSAYLYDNDNATQKWHNLMESDYTFTTKRGDNTTRFMLAVTVERKQPEITTALDNMSSKLTLTTINRTLVLSGLTSESDIYVYDVSGKLLSTGQYNASASGVFRTTVENAGVYFVRVCSKDGQQTLQTIVY